MIKKINVGLLLIAFSFILVGCGDPKVGDIFMLKRNTLGGVTVDSMERAMSEMRSFEEMGDSDSMEENVDFDAIPSLSVGTIVRVIETSEKKRMVRIQNMYPKTNGIMKMWIRIDDLNDALDKEY